MLLDAIRGGHPAGSHLATITTHTTQYHAFRKRAGTTPAAIIEIGFMHGDRACLTLQSDSVAAGIVKGLTCLYRRINPPRQLRQPQGA